MKNKNVRYLAIAAVIAAIYVVVSQVLSVVSFGIIQFRLSELLTVLPILTSAAIPGVFLGCLLANILNPMNLGIVDILGGSLTTLAAAYVTWKLSKGYRAEVNYNGSLTHSKKNLMQIIIALLPPVLFNALIVGTYLPFLLLEVGAKVTILSIIFCQVSILLSQSIIILIIGIPVLFLIERTKVFQDN